MEQIRWFEPRPITDDSSALDAAADGKSERASTVIGAAGAVRTNRSSEFREYDDRRIAPDVTEPVCQPFHGAVELCQFVGQGAGGAALIRVGIPASPIEHEDVRPVVSEQKLDGRIEKVIDLTAVVAPRPAVRAAARCLERGGQAFGEERIALIEIVDAAQSIVVDLR